MPSVKKTFKSVYFVPFSLFLQNLNIQDMRRPVIVEKIKDAMAKASPHARTILYGSEARGDARPDSDIDLLILVGQDKVTVADEEKLIAPLYDIELETGVLINATVMPETRWENRAMTTPFYLNVEREGITL